MAHPFRMSYENEWRNSSGNHLDLVGVDQRPRLTIERLGKDKDPV